MGAFIAWVIGAAVAALILFGVFAALTGRGEPLADAPPDGRPTGLPDDRMATGEEVSAARFDLAFRGYRMADVDAVLDRLSYEIDARDTEIARLRGVPRDDAYPDRAGTEDDGHEREPARHRAAESRDPGAHG